MKEYFYTDLDSYFGGKAAPGTLRTVINQIPPHRRRVSGFLGNCAVMRYLRPAAGKMQGYEIDAKVVAAWSKNTKIPGTSLEVINADFLEVMWDLEVDAQEVFIFLDPPYLWRTRTRRRYAFDLSDAEHRRLLTWCQSLTRAKVMLCGYPNVLYDELLPEWRTVEFEAITRGATMRTEKLWMNYKEPVALHDSRFIGADFREREKLKRRRETIYRKIERMDDDERIALFDRLKERFPGLFNQ